MMQFYHSHRRVWKGSPHGGATVCVCTATCHTACTQPATSRSRFTFRGFFNAMENVRQIAFALPDGGHQPLSCHSRTSYLSDKISVPVSFR
uniref:Putative secreted protein n=1 Tax=Anopheles marajoara TaxID=58244 RepID=A0A2M4CAE1_9DIPT